MPAASFTTTVGAGGAGRDGRDVVITHEPTLGSTLRTRGRFYLVCEVDPPSPKGARMAAEVGELVRAEYYYDLSAGTEVALRRALRKANRRAAQLVRDDRGRTRLHLACAAIVNNEVYAAKVGSAHVFLVRHARLFLPGEEPDELADFVHRTTTRQAASLGSEMDLLPLVWRQAIQASDTIVLASGSVVDALGAEELKNAAITLHPRAAAEHVRSRALADGATRSHASIFIEVAPAPSAAERLHGEPEVPLAPAAEVEIAERVRTRLDRATRILAVPGTLARRAVAPLGHALERLALIALELMPRRRAVLPRAQESARQRSARTYRATTLLAALLLLVTLGVAGLAVQDYQRNQVVNDYRLRLIDVTNGLDAASGVASRDKERAWELLDTAKRRLEGAASSPVADPVRIAKLRSDIGALEDRLNDVVIDLAKVAEGSAPTSLAQTVNGLYAADPGSGRLWRIWDDPIRTGVVLRRGERGVASPVGVAAEGEALFSVDDAHHVWRAEGNTVEDLGLAGSDKWKEAKGIATFRGNVYIFDPASGQVWRYAPDFAGKLQGPLPFLPEALPSAAARSFASDGDIWIVTQSGEVQRYRRLGNEPVLTRLPFTVQWTASPLVPTAIQALEAQSSIWLLDANARVVVQLTRDGREIARYAIPSHLPPPTAFFVSERQRIAYTAHGSKIAATDVSR